MMTAPWPAITQQIKAQEVLGIRCFAVNVFDQIQNDKLDKHGINSLLRHLKRKIVYSNLLFRLICLIS